MIMNEGFLGKKIMYLFTGRHVRIVPFRRLGRFFAEPIPSRRSTTTQHLLSDQV